MSQLKLTTTSFQAEREVIYGIRHAVFIVEQSVPEEIEVDEADTDAFHILAFLDGRPVGTGRITAAGRIGRMAVLKEFRNQGVGTEMLARLVEIGHDLGVATLGLSAQTQAIPFYEKFGFATTGAIYKEAGIEHRWMQKPIKLR